MNYQNNIDINNIPHMNNMENINNMGGEMPNKILNEMSKEPRLQTGLLSNKNIINEKNNKMQQFKNPNNLEYAMKIIDELSLKGTDLEENSSNNLSNNENLIKSITDEISKRLGTDKNLVKNNLNKELKKEKSNDNKLLKKQDDTNDTNNEKNSKSQSLMEKIINYNDIKDGAILFVIFFLLSQDMIKDFFCEYINCIGGDDEGKVNIKGVIIYGIILSILFLIVRKFI
jgi:hypothetical protein